MNNFLKKVLTQFYAPDTGGGNGGSSGESGDTPKDEYIEKMDPVTKKTVKIPKELEPVLGHFISTTRESIENKYGPIMKKLEDENTELSELKVEFDKLKEASMTAEEKAQENAKRVIKEHELKAKDAISEAEKWKGLFKEATIKNDILSSFGDTKLFNPGQVATLFKSEGRADIFEILDENGKGINEYETRVSLSLENDKGESISVEGTPGELFKRWIELDRNSHHVVNSLPAGSGSSRGGNGSKVKYSQEELFKMSDSNRLSVAREQTGSR